ncbi:1613_t:CDS:2 [Ambispora gerdemannii]|uniref:1613_t:CDS:1 n=1 Tax=Ambispora gerdemannii TaxID=144530 RepID=A0A9N9FIU6_9GLOM|nr:1613_t:CDS:2 [Ambispora gerdemannii]
MASLQTKGEIKVKKEDLKVGQEVIYHPVGMAVQTTKGIIKEIITESEIAGETHKTIKASPEHPRILIENLHTHKETGRRLKSQKHETHRAAHDKGHTKISDIKVGQYVIYHPIGSTQQTAEGLVKEIITADEVTGQAQRTVHATPEHPRILIENLHTQKETAYKPESIERVITEEEAKKLASTRAQSRSPNRQSQIPNKQGKRGRGKKEEKELEEDDDK